MWRAPELRPAFQIFPVPDAAASATHASKRIGMVVASALAGRCGISHRRRRLRTRHGWSPRKRFLPSRQLQQLCMPSADLGIGIQRQSGSCGWLRESQEPRGGVGRTLVCEDAVAQRREACLLYAGAVTRLLSCDGCSGCGVRLLLLGAPERCVAACER